MSLMSSPPVGVVVVGVVVVVIVIVVMSLLSLTYYIQQREQIAIDQNAFFRIKILNASQLDNAGELLSP